MNNVDESTIEYLNRLGRQAQPAQEQPVQEQPVQAQPAQEQPAQTQQAPAQQAQTQQAPAQQQVPQRNTIPNNVRFVSQETEKGRARVARIVTLAVLAGVLILGTVVSLKACDHIKSKKDDKDNDKKISNESDGNTLTYDEGVRYEDENGNPINVETQTIEEDFTSVIKETTSEGFVVTYTGKDGLKYSLVFDSEDTYNAWDASNGQIELKYEDGQLKLKNKTK